MRNWILIVLIVGLGAWAVYDFIDSGQSKDEAIEDALNDELSINSGSEGDIDKGDMAPDFQLENTEGEPVNLSDFEGEKILLNFWATWCPPCRDEMPDMQQFHEDNDDGVIIAVNLTASELKAGDVEDFLDEFGVTFNVLLDEDNAIADMYAAHGLPTSFFIKPNGEVHKKVMGGISYEYIEEQFAEMDDAS